MISVITPGPNNILSTSFSSKIGVKDSLPFTIGVFFGTFLVFITTGSLYYLLSGQVLILAKYIVYIGFLYIIFLAIRIAPSDSPMLLKDTGSRNFFLKSIVFSLVNPKTIFLGFMVASLVIPEGLSFLGYVVLSIILALTCFFGVLLWGGLGLLIMGHLNEYQKTLNITLASLLIFSAFILLLDTI